MSKKVVYCGDETTAEFLKDVLIQTLGLLVKCEIFTIDGEYHLEVEGDILD